MCTDTHILCNSHHSSVYNQIQRTNERTNEKKNEQIKITNTQQLMTHYQINDSNTFQI